MINQERIYNVLRAPHISEKAVNLADSYGQYVFRVAQDAEKAEIKAAVEKLFDVSVVKVRTARAKGKTKRTARGIGKRSDWKKAYVSLRQGQEIEFTSVS